MDDLGVLQFMPLESFIGGPMSQEEREDWLLQSLVSDTPPKPPPVSDWPRVFAAVCRGGLFVIEASNPSVKAMLSFRPGTQIGREYEIHRPRSAVETGRTVQAWVPTDELQVRTSMLAPFSIRFLVRTTPNERGATGLIWLVGLHSCNVVDEIEDSGA